MALPKMGLANDAPKSTEKVEPDTDAHAPVVNSNQIPICMHMRNGK